MCDNLANSLELRAATFCRWFTISAGCILLVTGMAKVISALGKAPILEVPDPIFSLSNRKVFLGVAVVEIMIAIYCLRGKKLPRKALLIGWLAACFMLYRFGLFWINYRQPCGCLGTMTDVLHLSPQQADSALKCIVAYLAAGSVVTLLLSKGRHQQNALVESSFTTDPAHLALRMIKENNEKSA